jgi:hypothetical protein
VSNVDVPATAGTDLDADKVCFLSAGDGGNTAGRWYLADADATYSSNLAEAVGFPVTNLSEDDTGNIRVAGRVTGLAGLSVGSVYFIAASAGSITSTAPANARAVGVADSTTSLILIPCVQEASATSPGLVSTGAQTLAGDKTFAGFAKSSGATSGIGYATGAGGTVTQQTDKSTGVTLSKVAGQITMNNAILNADTTVSFTLTNTAIAATDILVLNHVSGGTAGSYLLNAQAGAGSASINVRNITAGNLTEAIVIGFVVVKAVTS